ncbi:hypothetical protein MPNT_100056 [Candidatus Methylacidithermus pantelleriae]|uniref:Uncharacterized protein n=1 Tax=Candidatus Methylacidithermus pantelleriae TaxID=2744239 RepID=A0A8J2FV89_9BACT|nr:hypothetical protein MPNT_100056 [Candidatus Methylacidithermus pantelleriae]
MAFPSPRGCPSADEKTGLGKTIGLGSPSWLSGKALQIVEAVKEVGSRMKGHRRELVGQVGDPKVVVILVE